MTVFTKLKCWGSGEISKSWNSWMESAEIVCVRGKRGDLLTCSKTFCVNKRQLLPICRFAAKMQYILPLRTLSCRVTFLIEISTSSFWGADMSWGCLTLSQKKGAWRGWRARSPCSFDFIFQTLSNKNSCSSLACHFWGFSSTTHDNVMKKISWLEICCQMSHVLSFFEVQQAIFYIIRCSLWTWHNVAE